MENTNMNVEKTNTVTISVDEYFDLKTKAQTNAILAKEFGTIEGQINAITNQMNAVIQKIFELEQRVVDLEPKEDNN